MKKTDPKVKDILLLLSMGAILTGSLFMPGLPFLLKPLLANQKNGDGGFEKYNSWRVRSMIKKLHKQKLIELTETWEGYKVEITEKGRKRILVYNLETLALNEKEWDRKWRIIIYDVYESKRNYRILFQKYLRKLHFFQLQKSVYLTPFECGKEIEYLRQICEIGTEVVILTISGLENEEVYKKYFDLG